MEIFLQRFSFLKINFIYLFFGCSESLSLRGLFSSCGKRGLLSTCGCSGFSLWRLLSLLSMGSRHVGSIVPVPEL